MPVKFSPYLDLDHPRSIVVEYAKILYRVFTGIQNIQQLRGQVNQTFGWEISSPYGLYTLEQFIQTTSLHRCLAAALTTKLLYFEYTDSEIKKLVTKETEEILQFANKADSLEGNLRYMSLNTLLELWDTPEEELKQRFLQEVG